MSNVEALEAVKKRRARKASAKAEPDMPSEAPSAAQDEPQAEAPTEAKAVPVPGLDGRPCWRVLDDWTDPGDGGSKLRPGVWYFGIKAGKGDSPPMLTQTHVCGPLYVTAETTNAAGANFGRLLRFRTTRGTWKEWAMPMTLLASDGAELRSELLYMGLEIDPQARHLLPQYIQHRTPKRRMRCVEQTGWAGVGLDAYVLPDVVIGPDAADVVYQSGEHASEEYTTAGTLAGWQEGIAAQAVGNPLLALAICCAFAGPVLARCNAESGGLHLVGDSSTGKSTAIEAARSVWGGAGFKRSWRTTGNGLEGAAALFNDCLLALDEISECDPREVGAIVYSLGNGRGKQRAGRSGAARNVKTWRVSVLSSGERTIGTTMAEGGHRIKAGQSVRLLDVGAQREHGAWDELHGHTSGSSMSDHLKRQSGEQYGHAGRAFLERLAWDESDLAQALDTIKALPEFTPAPGADGQVLRAASRFALLALAGEPATEYGVTPWPDGEAIAAAAAGLRSWLELRGDARATHEEGQIMDRLAEFLEKHGDSRFTDKNHPPSPERAALIRDRAGWYELAADGGRRYLFTASGLRDALQGFDQDQARAVLEARGVLIVPEGQGGKKSKPVSIDGIKTRVYVINPAALYPDGDGES